MQPLQRSYKRERNKMGNISNGTSQAHGKTFEGHVKNQYPGSSDSKRSPTSAFDIEAKYDKKKGIPTQVKSAKRAANGNTTVCLSDARRAVSHAEAFRLVVVEWTQGTPGRKNPSRVVEMEFDKGAWNANVVGKLKESFVETYHDSISSFGEGAANAKKARALSDQFDAEFAKLYAKGSVLKLNRKIDSKNQRRLQCSASLNDLMAASSRHKTFLPDESGTSVEYRDVIIPQVKSESRKFDKDGAKAKPQ